jgi:hypothetical protein
MSEDPEALAKEIQRVLKVNRRWRAIAIAALLLVFVVMLPFITSTQEVVEFFKNRDTAAMQRQQEEEREKYERWEEEADKQLNKQLEAIKRMRRNAVEPDD